MSSIERQRSPESIDEDVVSDPAAEQHHHVTGETAGKTDVEDGQEANARQTAKTNEAYELPTRLSEMNERCEENNVIPLSSGVNTSGKIFSRIKLVLTVLVYLYYVMTLMATRELVTKLTVPQRYGNNKLARNTNIF